MNSLVLLTPTCARDRDRFRLLRESIRFFDVDLPHIVVINTGDDASSFVDRADSNVEILTVGEFLPAALARKATRPFRRRDPRYWSGRHWRDEPRLAGWTLQQLIKFAALRQFGSTGTIVCLDSDLFVLRQIEAAHFQSRDGRSLLFESFDTEAEMLGWELTAMDYLDVPRRANRAARHTFEPNVLDVAVGTALLDLLEEIGGTPWWAAFLTSGLTEYTLYGVFAQFLAKPGLVQPAPPIPLYEARNSFDVRTYAEGLRRGADGAIVGMVRSALGVPADVYAPLVRSFWNSAT